MIRTKKGKLIMKGSIPEITLDTYIILRGLYQCLIDKWHLSKDEARQFIKDTADESLLTNEELKEKNILLEKTLSVFERMVK